MICSRFLFLAFVLCATFFPTNAFFKEENDLREIIQAFTEVESTPKIVIDRLQSALAKGKIIYSANELSELLQTVFTAPDDDSSEEEIDLAGGCTMGYDDEEEIGSCGASPFGYDDDEEEMGSCEEETYGYDDEEPSTTADDKDINDELFQEGLKKFFPVDLPEEPEEKGEKDEAVVEEEAAVEEKAAVEEEAALEEAAAVEEPAAVAEEAAVEEEVAVEEKEEEVRVEPSEEAEVVEDEEETETIKEEL